MENVDQMDIFMNSHEVFKDFINKSGENMIKLKIISNQT